jgi:hypothetical protein
LLKIKIKIATLLIVGESAKDINVIDLCEYVFHEETQHKFMTVVDLNDLRIHCMLGQMNDKSFAVERAPCLDKLFRIPIYHWSFLHHKNQQKISCELYGLCVK